MSGDTPKETPKFSFGGGSTGGSLFGGGSNTPSGGSIFGGGSKPAGSSIFGSNTGTSGTAGESLFGGSTTPASTGASQPSIFGSGGTPSAANTGSIFGGGAGTSGSSPFKLGGAAATPSTATGASTPAPKTAFSFGGSTTPAGPPPASSTGGGLSFGSQPSGQRNTSTPSLFGGANSATPKPASNPFGNLGGGTQRSPAQSTPGTAAPNTSNSGGFTLGGASTGTKPAFSSGSTGTQPGSSPFALGGSTPASSQPAQEASKPPSTGLFGNLGSSTGNKPTFSLGGAASGTQSTPSAQTTSSPFPSLTAGSSQPVITQAATTTAAGDKPSLFPGATNTPTPGGLGNIFGGGAKDKDKDATSGTAAPQTPATSGFNLFSNKPVETPALSTAQTTPGSATPAAKPAFTLGSTPAATSSAATSQPSTTTTSAPTFSLGGATSTSTPQASTTATTGTAVASTPAPVGASATNLGASTIGAPPSAQSRLKNKSMDEIITRWATDLSKYQKSFQTQAQQVATWDRMLVENSDKISKLYSKTFQARKDTEEVERQLTAVESDQAELSRWLDSYEKEVDELMDKMVGGAEGLQGPDQERERTYKLAEKLSDRLNDLNKDLSEMIEEINSVSATLSKTDKPDDPLSQVVRVLNNHLSQLQAIDTGAAELHAKVASAQKESQNYRVNGHAGLGSDAAEDFYRSFMSRR